MTLTNVAFAILAMPLSLLFALIMYVVVMSRRRARELQYFKQLINTCTQVNGEQYTKKLLTHFVDRKLSFHDMVEVLEYHIKK